MMRPAARLELSAAAVGVVVGAVVGVFYRVEIGPVAGWDAAGIVYLAVIWRTVWPLDADGSADHASKHDDPSRGISDAAILLAAVASLVAVAALIAQSHSSKGVLQAVELGVGVGSVVISWLLVHTLFTLRYARLYYRGDEGGVEFEDRVRPSYSDFAYLALTVGMTFQVSDTDLQTTEFRRLVLMHALLSYLFGAVILASAINLIAGLAR